MRVHLLHITLWLCIPLALASQDLDYPIDLEQLKSCEISNLKEINTEHLEFSPAFYNDGIIYVASKPRGKKFDKKIKESFFDLKYYNFKTGSESKDFYEKGVNDLHHFGPCAFNGQDKEIFYSVNYTDKKGADGRYHMKLLSAKYQDTGWQTVDDFPFNSHEYSIFHPAISADGMTLVFASNMPGGYGKMDLYSIQKKEEGGWTLPENLGPEINTEANDWFPNFHKNEFLFYSSETKGGLGGLDIYVCKHINDTWKYPQHLDHPVNSKMDDIGFALSPDGSFGFFSSNRKGGRGKDDIYKFEFPQPMSFPEIETAVGEAQLMSNVNEAPEVDVQFLILDEGSKKPLNNAEVSITPLLADDNINLEDYKTKYTQQDAKTGKLKLLTTPSPILLAQKETSYTKVNGLVDLSMSKHQLYLLELNYDGYESDQTILDMSILKNDPSVLISLQKKAHPRSVAVAKKPSPSRNPTPSPRPSPTPNTKTSDSSTPPNANNSVLEIPKSIGELIVFENLLYEYNEATIKKGGTKELVALAEYMMTYPQLEVELSSHTDAIGSAPYNLQLSQRRAEYAKEFLVEHGIDPARIVAKGYGEKVIRNHCVEGVICTDDEHAYNRRTELKITKK